MRVRSGQDQPSLAFRVLGPLEVVSGQELVAVRRRQHRVLLTVLLLRAGEVCPRSWLSAAIWGKHVPASGPDALRTAVRGLRRDLGGLAGYVQTRQAGPVPGGYLIQAGEDDADILAFRARAEAGRRAWYEGDAAGAARLLAGALRLWRGEPSDMPATPAAQAVLAPVRAELSEAQDLEVDARLALGQHQGVVPLLRARTTGDPLREHAWAQLVMALHRCGDQPGALSAYKAAHAAVTAAYGAEPGPELAAVYLEIRAAARDRR
jgi:DNA-binding SARP family transcriptional activator